MRVTREESVAWFRPPHAHSSKIKMLYRTRQSRLDFCLIKVSEARRAIKRPDKADRGHLPFEMPGHVGPASEKDGNIEISLSISSVLPLKT